MSELEKQQAKEIEELRELLGLKSKDKSKAFSDVTMYDLEKLGDNRYQYFVSANFDSSKIDDLKGIFRNLLFVKDEIVDIVKSNL